MVDTLGKLTIKGSIYAPEELRTGPFISESECETEGCSGKIALGIRIVAVDAPASDDGSDN
ncbi:MAG: hypothetical protein O3A96_07000 [Proteobacteria bacterium]|nr:hypothetical protein [Pseudomonadota bacterium]